MKFISLVGVLVVVLSACGSTTTSVPTTTPIASVGAIEIRDAWARLPMATGGDDGMAMGESTSTAGENHSTDVGTPTTVADDMDGMNSSIAVYLTIHNSGGTPDTLTNISVDSTIASAAEVHQTTIDANGVASMMPAEKVEIPANSDVQFKTGSYHIMLINPSSTLKVGDSVSLTMHFAQAGSAVIQAELRTQ